MAAEAAGPFRKTGWGPRGLVDKTLLPHVRTWRKDPEKQVDGASSRIDSRMTFVHCPCPWAPFAGTLLLLH